MNYQKLIIIDLEATCWSPSEFEKSNVSEIIEIGLVEIDLLKWDISRQRQFYVKPSFSFPSEYCTALTGITKKTLLKQGLPYPKVVDILKSKFGTKNKIFAGWGEDGEMIAKQSRLFNLESPFSNSYINLSFLYSIKNNSFNKIPLLEALENEGLDFKGEAHSGIDDAYNTALLFLKVFKGF